MSEPRQPIQIAHETRLRLRFVLPAGLDLAGAAAALRSVPGVESVRESQATRSLVARYDGRSATRSAILETLEPGSWQAIQAPDGLVVTRSTSAPGIGLPAMASVVAPLLPPPARAAVALALIAERVLRDHRRSVDPTATALDALALASTTLTGHGGTATVSLLLSALAERRRDVLLLEADRQLAELVPAASGPWQAQRAGQTAEMLDSSLAPGDHVWVHAGERIPADGLVIEGEAAAEASVVDDTARTLKVGDRLGSGLRLRSGRLRLRVEQPASTSRAARLRDHVQHVLRTREKPGALSPDLERLVALPITAAGLVLSLTGDAGRSAAMLQADPQLGISLAHPVAREAALHALLKAGALLQDLEGVDRLATATSIAFEDIGILTEPAWRISQVELLADDISLPTVHEWLAGLAELPTPDLLEHGLADSLVTSWREHGAVLRLPDKLLHFGGAAVIARTWSLKLPSVDRRSLIRRIGVVADGRLLATIHLQAPLRQGLAGQFQRLRELGIRRIAIFTEDPAASPAAALQALGADAIVCESRRAQESWLAAEMEHGAGVVLVHTGLRELLPPGGLSLCPVHGESGAHGVLLHDPLPSLVSARETAAALRMRLRRRFGQAVALNAALLVATAMRWSPPLATAAVKHGIALLLIEASSRLARSAAPSAPLHEAGTDPMSELKEESAT